MLLFESVFVVFCKQKTAYEMRISDWSSDVCSSDLVNMNEGQRKVLIHGNRLPSLSLFAFPLNLSLVSANNPPGHVTINPTASRSPFITRILTEHQPQLEIFKQLLVILFVSKRVPGWKLRWLGKPEIGVRNLHKQQKRETKSAGK